jgi:hypothetical protein
MKDILREDRLEDSPMRNSAVGYKPTVPFRKIYGGDSVPVVPPPANIRPPLRGYGRT